MVDKEYLELIHKDIDGIISPRERDKLSAYLAANADAALLHQELMESEKMLDTLQPKEPSENLKKRIMNSIDYNRYAPKSGKSRSVLSRYRPGLILSFSLGIIAGIILITAIFSNPELLHTNNREDVSGTIGGSELNVVEEIDFGIPGVAGNIEVMRNTSLTRFGLNFEFESSSELNVQLLYDPSEAVFDKLISDDVDKLNVVRENGKLNITSLKNGYTLLFTSKKPAADLDIRIFSNGSRIFDRSVIISE